MSRLTGNDAYGLMEAYNNVYAPQEEITEEQLWEEVEVWVNSFVEEGYDLSEYTWEEMYEAYLSEAGMDMFNTPAAREARQRAASNILSGNFGRSTARIAPQPTAARNPLTIPSPSTTAQRPVDVFRDKPQLRAARDAAGRDAVNRIYGLRPGAPAPAARPSGGTPAPAARPSGGTPAPAARPSGGSAAAPAAPTGKSAPTAKTSSSASASTAEKIAGGMKTYEAQKKAGDIEGAEKTGMDVWKTKYKDTLAKPKTPNPLMKDMPGQNKTLMKGIQTNTQKPTPTNPGYAKGTKASTSGPKLMGGPSGPGKIDAGSVASDLAKANASANKPLSSTAAVDATTKPVDDVTKKQQKIAAAPRPVTVNPSGKGDGPLWEEVDTFDVVLEYLISEGFADTNEAALAIMANMSEEWRDSIVEAVGIVGPPSKPIDAIPGVRNLRVGLSNAVKRSEYGANDPVRKVGKHVVPSGRDSRFDKAAVDASPDAATAKSKPTRR